MKNETIKFKDFLSDAADALGLDKNDLKPDTGVYYKCPKCKDYYSEKEKFCSNDGEAIVEEPYEYLSKDTKRFIMDILYDLTTAELPDSFPYEYVDSIEKRGDGSGYYMNFVFKRKSDGKFFYYCSYDCRIEDNELQETKQKVKITWEFESHFS